MTTKGDGSPAEPIANHQVLWLKNWTAADIHQEYPLNPLNAELNPICHLLALLGAHHILHVSKIRVMSPWMLQCQIACTPFCSCVLTVNSQMGKHQPINPLNPELNPICYLLALLGAHHFLHVSRIRVKLLTFMLLMSYIYGAPILDVSRSHTTTQHSR